MPLLNQIARVTELYQHDLDVLRAQYMGPGGVLTVFREALSHEVPGPVREEAEEALEDLTAFIRGTR